MAAKKSATEAMKHMIAAMNEFAYGISLVGGFFIVVTGGVAAAVSHSKDLRKELAVAHKDLEVAHKDLEVARIEACKDLELARIEARKDVETARHETAEKFLTYGFVEEYNNYQKLLKLRKGEAEAVAEEEVETQGTDEAAVLDLGKKDKTPTEVHTGSDKILPKSSTPAPKEASSE